MHEDNCAVYVHVNLINGKKYFGITVREPEARWGKDGKGYEKNDHFWNAINKYGWNEGFAHYVLYRNVPIKIAKNIEEMLIQEHISYDPRFGYNLTYGGELEKHTKETRLKISEAQKGEKNHMYGKHHSKEACRKIRKNQPMIRPVEAIDHKTGLRVYYFESTRDAERAGFDHGNISKCCNGKLKTYKKYIWRFVNEEVNNNDPDSGQ